MSIETQLETYEDSGTINKQKEALQTLLVEAENMKTEYLRGKDESFLDKVKQLLGFQKKEQENELLPMIDELVLRIVEENRKIGNLYR